MKTTRPRLPIDEVMAQVQARLPALVPHCYLDGEWIWYCGPSLAGADNAATRETLKEIGFRFAFKGHVMRDSAGHPTTTVGTWGHSCQRPLPPRRRGRQPTESESAPSSPSASLDCINSL